MAKEDGADSLVLFSVDDHGKAIRGGLRGHALLYALGQVQRQELIVDAYVENGFEHDRRDYSEIGRILSELSISRMRLLTNNPERILAFQSMGYQVERYPIEQPYNPLLAEELGVKKSKLGHLLDLTGFSPSDLQIYGLSEKDLEN
jgi:GTP cyclohydrolase II